MIMLHPRKFKPLFFVLFFTLFLALSLCAQLFLLPPSAKAGELSAEVSDRFVAVTTGFSGAKIMVFGVHEPAAQILITIKGPPVQSNIWQYQRLFGIWQKTEPMTFTPIPGYFAIASSVSLSNLPQQYIKQLGLSLQTLNFEPKSGNSNNIPAYRSGLIQAMEKRNLYQENIATVRQIDDKLFRADFNLPPNMPVGKYEAQVYVFRNNEVVDNTVMPFDVAKVGLSAYLYDLAHEHSILYAFLSLASAIAIGSGSNLLFRRK